MLMFFAVSTALIAAGAAVTEDHGKNCTAHTNCSGDGYIGKNCTDNRNCTGEGYIGTCNHASEICECAAGFFPFVSSCAKIYNHPCSTSGVCTRMEYTCDNTTHVCVCTVGYNLQGAECKKSHSASIRISLWLLGLLAMMVQATN